MGSDVCAVRTLSESRVQYRGEDKDFPKLRYTLSFEFMLPHEPKSEHCFALRLVRADGLQPGYVGNYAECKHCGCIYATEKE